LCTYQSAVEGGKKITPLRFLSLPGGNYEIRDIHKHEQTGHPLYKLAFPKFLEGYLNRIPEHKNMVESQKKEIGMVFLC